MGTTYEYTYEYEVTDSNKHNRNTGNHTQRTTGQHTNYTALPRSSNMDPLVNLQHDRIWHKLYDPLNTDKSSHETEAQVCSFFYSINNILFSLKSFESFFFVFFSARFKLLR